MDLIIAALPFAGSSVLAKMLEQNGIPRPEPHLYPALPGRFAQAIAARETTEDFLRRVTEERQTNRVFGTIVFADWCAAMQRYSGSRLAGWPEILAQFFPDAKYIFLYREDVLRQAVAACRASKAGRQEHFHEDAATNWKGALSPREIHSQLLNIIWQEEVWLNYFLLYDIRHMALSAEELETNTGRSLAGVLEYLGLSSEAPLSAPALKQQAGDQQAESYLGDYLRSGLFDLLRARFERLYARNIVR